MVSGNSIHVQLALRQKQHGKGTLVEQTCSSKSLICLEGNWIIGVLYSSVDSFIGEFSSSCAVRRWALVGEVGFWGHPWKDIVLSLAPPLYFLAAVG